MHTKMGDGKETLPDLLDMELESYGLDFIGTSDHGGAGTRDPYGELWEDIGIEFEGDEWYNPQSVQGMWRWLLLLFLPGLKTGTAILNIIEHSLVNQINFYNVFNLKRISSLRAIILSTNFLLPPFSMITSKIF